VGDSAAIMSATAKGTMKCFRMATPLDFPQSGDVAERLGQVFEERTRDFDRIRVVT
jgi:hypothetical protein